MRRTRLAGQALLALASCLFVGGAIAMTVGIVAVGDLMPLAGVAVACLVVGGALARP
ncbi:MAG: hypothetical protein ABEJ73_03250 [Haloplanus sp.]